MDGLQTERHSTEVLLLLFCCWKEMLIFCLDCLLFVIKEDKLDEIYLKLTRRFTPLQLLAQRKHNPLKVLRPSETRKILLLMNRYQTLCTCLYPLLCLYQVLLPVFTSVVKAICAQFNFCQLSRKLFVGRTHTQPLLINWRSTSHVWRRNCYGCWRLKVFFYLHRVLKMMFPCNPSCRQAVELEQEKLQKISK